MPVPRRGKENGEEGAVEQKSKEQLEAEKKAVLAQRISPLELSGLDVAALLEKVKEVHERIYKLESDKYDLEERFKKQQVEMAELQERAREMSRGGGKKRSGVEDAHHPPCPFDRLADKYTNAPPKINTCSKYDRQTDTRDYSARRNLFEEYEKKLKEEADAPKSEAVANGEEGGEGEE